MRNKQLYESVLSRAQIDAYRNSSEQERREIEGSVNGAFEQDALDGWQMSPVGTSSMKRLDKKFKAPSSMPLYTAGVALTVAAVTAGLFFFNTTPGKPAETKKVELSVEQTDISLPTAIDTLEALPETEQIRIASLKTSQQEIQNQPVSVPTTDVEEIPAIVLHPLALTSPKETVKIAKQRTAKEVSYHDLKVVDYSAYRDKPTIAAERIVLSGTPANLESENNESTETTITAVDIPYMDYINKTMRYVNKGKWKESLQRLQLILKTYPDDVNAHFYAGLCSYNLQQYEEAKQHFANCLQLPFSNFNEESSWYLAQSLLANGEKSQAKELLMVICDQKGYYSKQAEKVLKTW